MVVSDSFLSLMIPLVRCGMTDGDKEERHVFASAVHDVIC